MNQVVEILADSFEKAVKGSDKPVVIEFWIKSCESCRKFGPVFEKLPNIFGDKVEFMKMDLFLSLKNLKLAEDLGVEETPTLKLFCRGKEVGQIIGNRPLDMVLGEIQEILERGQYCRGQSGI